MATGCVFGFNDDVQRIDPSVFECYRGGMPQGAEMDGIIEIGTGRDHYEPLLPDHHLKLHMGIQGGFHFELRPRIQGLNPGEAGDPRSPKNPRTLFSGYNEDGERIDVHDCGFFLPYQEGEDYHDLGWARLVEFSARTRPNVGDRVRVVADIIDIAGRYATSETWVVVSDQ